MLKFKEVDLSDIDRKWKIYTNMPNNENGFTNIYNGISKKDFIDVLKEQIKHSKGIDLPIKFVPYTEFYLYDDEDIVGIFRLRYELNYFLTYNSGHIGYMILKEYRNKGYAKKGMQFILEEAKKRVKEDFVQLSALKTNIFSIRVIEKSGGKKFFENDKQYFYKISIR